MSKLERKSQLNNSQKEAVDHKSGPLLVVAGAGTGKTRVIVERIVRLIDSGISPENILALTFTEKAASEMLDRVNELRGGYTLDATVSTYNTFGAQLLRRFASEIGLGSNPKLLGETGQLVYLRENLDTLKLDYYAPISNPDSQLEVIAAHISRLKQQLISPEEYLKYTKSMPSSKAELKVEKKRHIELANTYKIYSDLCRQNSVIDYDDQIYLVVKLLSSRPNILKHLQREYQYILVDEFQDTNPMQSKLLDLLSGDSQNIMVVGDDDQSIYGWRGATLANILDFKMRYPKSKEVTLIKNYRSGQDVLDSAYQLIQHNNPHRLEAMHTLNKRLISTTAKSKLPVVMHFSNFESELAWIAEDVASKITGGVPPGQIAVLARRNSGVQRIHESFELAEIKHAVAGLSSDLYRQQSVASLIEALKAISDPMDDRALYHTLGGPIFKISPPFLAESVSLARSTHKRLFSVLKMYKDKKLAEAIKLIETWQVTLHELSARQIAYNILSDSGWKDELYVNAESDQAIALQVQALGQYFVTLKEFERIADTPSLISYLDNLDNLRASGTELEDHTLQISESVVNVLSIHKAKGLEWDHVYIIDCTEGSLPLKKFSSSLQIPAKLMVHSAADDHIAEERRLMYVAVTRAKNELILSYSDTHTGTTKRYRSRFIAELVDENQTENDQTNSEKSPSIEEGIESSNFSRPVSIPSSMVAGDKIILSVSQIDTFLKCPLEFYYRYILNAPEPYDPVLSYGSLIHLIIQKIYQGMKDDKLPKLEDLLAEAKSKWPQAGYHSAKQRERAHRQGEKTIRKLYRRLPESRAPTDIEKSFRVHIPDSSLILTGRIDSVFTNEEGSEIRDYKTGTSVTTKEKAKRRAQNSVQLSLYASAWQIMTGEIPFKLVLDFVETDQIGEVRKRTQTLMKLESKISKIPTTIRSGKFPSGKDHSYCNHPL